MFNINDKVYEALKDILPIYPLVAPENVDYPFATYSCVNMDCLFTKQQIVGGTAEFNVSVVTDEYADSAELKQRIMQVLSKRNDLMQLGCSETYSDGAFIQDITFTLTF
jgi:hypothetical protein